ncbi:MAG: MraY family glycosyltransferase [Anaerolineae bacterium]|nr:undecaprenyl/decaprenyl-phosphate alpha-N-acetylglucosaminyl 1-phosphate transferase [Chloroflexota bacterium]
MAQYLLIVLSAFIVAASATPLMRKVAFKIGILDLPSARKVHSRPMPLTGGVAIFVAFIGSLLLLGDRSYVREVIGILVGATICSFMGLWDDKSSLRPRAKLLVQLLAAGILVISGVAIQLPWLKAFNIVVTLFWIVGITNAMNLLDNMDGLAGGVATIASAFFLLLAAMNGQYLVGALAAAVMGACVGFLLYNLNPARIFMGDSGALFLGFVLSALAIKLRFPGLSTSVSWLIPLVVLGVPVFDTTLVTISRLRRGLNPLTTPGRDHLSHRLVAYGLSPREAVLVIYLMCGALGVVAMFLMQASPRLSYAIAIALVLALGALIWRLERDFVRRNQAPTTGG